MGVESCDHGHKTPEQGSEFLQGGLSGVTVCICVNMQHVQHKQSRHSTWNESNTWKKKTQLHRFCSGYWFLSLNLWSAISVWLRLTLSTMLSFLFCFFVLFWIQLLEKINTPDVEGSNCVYTLWKNRTYFLTKYNTVSCDWHTRLYCYCTPQPSPDPSILHLKFVLLYLDIFYSQWKLFQACITQAIEGYFYG